MSKFQHRFIDGKLFLYNPLCICGAAIRVPDYEFRGPGINPDVTHTSCRPELSKSKQTRLAGSRLSSVCTSLFDNNTHVRAHFSLHHLHHLIINLSCFLAPSPPHTPHKKNDMYGVSKSMRQHMFVYFLGRSGLEGITGSRRGEVNAYVHYYQTGIC